ncbi:hypothetical protein AYY19_12590 [Photobacterium aquimaris]|uniref:hypothetical protein n=1 Tax=Photobacterium aquimaris TaxID=512643 RepID=UPI0007EFEF80|nr:hypothetical protein [Photobacterium aquimaris]OBU17722.1 hypothetical protein AYY19_12590 [Photobacterium aquimaris]PSV99535.1 hypothetical protein CTM91_14525 [Photobacterium aquimaris]
MDIKHLTTGMWVESCHGVGKVIGIDHQHHSVIIEHHHDHQLQSIDIVELIDQPQLHNGCDRYY